jgi:CRISPR-associated exonuclease Cas4
LELEMNANPSVILAFVLVLVAAACWLLARVLRWRSGLPAGDLVYEDTSGADSAVLFSAHYGLRGKPDYLLEEDEGLVPVEVKSSHAPRNGQPYASHLMQLAAYFLLVEEEFDQPVLYGLIRYRDRTLRIENSDELRAELLAVLAEMRAILQAGTAQRSHNQARRCAGCSVAYACEERLA